MTSSNTFTRFLTTALASLFLATGFAQMNSANPLVGTWQTSIELGQGLPPATGIFRAQADGQYREELYIQGQLAAYWQGQYTLAPDGTLTQQETSKSPQICMQGQCMANDGPSTTTSRVSLQAADVFTVTVQDPSSGQVFTVNWQRMGQPGPAPVGPTPAGPTPTPVGPAPVGPTPVGPTPPSPVAQTPIVGTWQYQERGQAGVVTVLLNYTADGRFQVQRILNGQQFVASYGGTYTFNNGMLVETTTEKSPQFCYRYCEPNPAQLGTAGPMQVSFPNANTLIYAGISFQRAPNQGGAVPAQSGGMTPVTPGGLGATPDMTGGWGTPAPNTGGWEPGGFTGPADNGSFVDGVIWEQSPYVDPNTGGAFLLPNSPDADTSYTAPSGNDLRYDDTLGTWYEVDPYGFETEVEEGSW